MMVRRLIETDEMPIGVISEHSRKDQNVRKGHLHTLHVWWATRPLAACRAVLIATLLLDPADPNCPEAFRREARQALKSFTGRELSDPLTLRRVLLDFIGHFAGWKRAHDQVFVETARRLVAAAHPDGPPLVVDPFAGIGSIPFEALRIGADAYAGDLNPVAVLLDKVALEYLPTYGLRLAEAVRKWGEWVRARATDELRHFYPLEPDGSEPLAYLWARTIRCEGPGCGAEVPLVGLLWLSRREKHRVALRYRGDKATKQVVFEIFEPKSESEVQPPIVKGFAATCPVCGYTTPYKRVREQIRARQGGTRDARMIVVITLRRDGSRGFRLATEEDEAVARLIIHALGAHEELLRRPGGILEVKGNIARLVPVAERRRSLIGKAFGRASASTPEMPRRRRRGQPSLFEGPAPQPETEASLAPGASTLDRLHQAMLLFADGRSEALRRFLVDKGVGRDAQFWGPAVIHPLLKHLNRPAAQYGQPVEVPSPAEGVYTLPPGAGQGKLRVRGLGLL
jgi:hypothetical protein